MRFNLSRVGTISKRTDETVRFPTVGVLNADYMIRDQDKKEAGKARVEEGTITVLALRSDLSDLDRDRVRDMLVRGIIEDADRQNANLSIEILDKDFDLTETKRFFERFGFRAVSDTIMKRLAGSIHPGSLAEVWTRGWKIGIQEAMKEGPNPDFHFLNAHRGHMDRLRQRIVAHAEQYVHQQLAKLHKLMPGHQFEYMNAMGAEFVSMEPGIIDKQHGDNFGTGDLDDIQERYNWMTQDGEQVPHGILMIGPIIENIFELNAYMKEHFGIELDPVKMNVAPQVPIRPTRNPI